MIRPNIPTSIQDLLNVGMGYISKGTITVTCSITAVLSSRSEAVDGLRGVKRRCTDVKITVGDRHLYANKGVRDFAIV